MYDMGRGLTVFKSDEGFGKKDPNIKDKRTLFCVITRL
jgi:hypothetical protein